MEKRPREPRVSKPWRSRFKALTAVSSVSAPTASGLSPGRRLALPDQANAEARAQTLAVAVLVRPAPTDPDREPDALSVRCVALALGLPVPTAALRLRQAHAAGLVKFTAKYTSRAARRVVAAPMAAWLRPLAVALDPSHPAFSPTSLGGLGLDAWLALALARTGSPVPAWLAASLDRARVALGTVTGSLRRPLRRLARRLGLARLRERLAAVIAGERRAYHRTQQAAPTVVGDPPASEPIRRTPAVPAHLHDRITAATPHLPVTPSSPATDSGPPTPAADALNVLLAVLRALWAILRPHRRPR